ncbi:protocatechuate 4,5-dioxygenase subunit alpha [Aurantiacibacter suaedae]|uniref:protocatechuate 4,5-dioxygenase subunit alpha n=1 Tax=Aurantiacibacter suaedae TaxID=2545755 RepID=UPI0010F71A9D|nr:protocatechuate 4,5-dioxygenase subunit alpha [Aurantiacibacter suaedae]
MLPTSDTSQGKRTIPGTPVFDGEQARSGYALNAMCYAFNSAELRDEFVKDEEAVMERFHLTEQQRDAVRKRDILAMLEAGGNVYYLAKLAGILGFNVQQLGALQTGMELEDFKAALLAHGLTETRNILTEKAA